MAQLFNDNVFSIGDVKSCYIAARQLNGQPIQFPIEYLTVSGTSDSVIKVPSFDIVSNVATLGGQLIEFQEVSNLGGNIVFEETYEEGRQGKTFNKILQFTLPRVNYYTNASLKEFLFTSDGQFAISNVIAFITDENNNQWIVGYDIPLILQDNMEISLGNENYYRLIFRSISYSRTRNYQVGD
jgi:hypothetical protein